MRQFETLEEAALEIKRDVAKGTPVESSRVQGWTDKSLQGRERFGYLYSIRDTDTVPHSATELVTFGKRLGFPLYLQKPEAMIDWLEAEEEARRNPDFTLPPPDLDNPALTKTAEGGTFSYLYRERLHGMIPVLADVLTRNPDTRRAYWPIYQPLDALRAGEPTRIPCSLGYQPMIRVVNGEKRLLWFYLQRSCDFDRFWLSDVWFAVKMQREILFSMSVADVSLGAFIHFITSLHRFDDGEEVY